MEFLPHVFLRSALLRANLQKLPQLVLQASTFDRPSKDDILSQLCVPVTGFLVFEAGTLVRCDPLRNYTSDSEHDLLSVE